MPILAGDIKLLASSVMQDVPEGGGAPTANVISDGTSNAVFPDVSELDRAGGRFNMRKLHVSVQTLDTDTYMGANVIVAEPPEDPNISITLVNTNSVFDTRAEAANLIESYLTRATVWRGYLLENHVAGQRSIQIFQHPTAPLPTIGVTLVLIWHEGLPDEAVQYVRVIRTEDTIATFIKPNTEGTEYLARVVTCDISDALRIAFNGSPPFYYFTPAAGATVIRTTTVADAGAYYGVVPLRKEALLGVSKLSATSVYSKLVPSAATESVSLDVVPSAQRAIQLASSPRVVSVGVAPHSLRVKIGQESRAFNYVQILTPPPAPGTLEVAFLALGEWYTLQDDGAGALTGQGAGTVNYTTGSVSVTLPVMPDVASSVVFTWGEKLGFVSMAGNVTFRAPEFSFDLAHKGIDPGSLVVTWLSGGNLKTATAAANGTLSGDATGYVAHTTGMLTLRPTAMLDAGGEFNLSYTWSTVVTETKTGLSASGGGLVTFALDQVPVQGSIMVDWFTTRSVSDTSGSALASGSSLKSASTNTGTQTTQVLDSKTVHLPGYASYAPPIEYQAVG